jgi:hypothetical protein
VRPDQAMSTFALLAGGVLASSWSSPAPKRRRVPAKTSRSWHCAQLASTPRKPPLSITRRSLPSTTEDKSEMRISSLQDIERDEATPLAQRDVPQSTYEMLRRGAGVAPDNPALSFFFSVDRYREPFVWTY